MSKELKESMTMKSHKIEYINKEIEITKEYINSGVENYNDWKENFISRLHSRFKLEEERNSKLEDWSIDIIQPEEQKEKRIEKTEQSQRPVVHRQAYQKIYNGSQRRREKERGTKNI